MNWANITWWVVYVCLAIIGQSFFPGIDFLLPGFIIAIQERDGVQLAWVFGLFMVLQEGMGNMAFGGVLLWYLLAIVMFYLCYGLFEVQNMLFIFLLCGGLGATHWGIMALMATLQDIPVNLNTLMEESIIQALFTPFIWRAVAFTRRWVPRVQPV